MFRALFLAYDTSNVQRLWVTDGTDAGTTLLSVAALSSSVIPSLGYSAALAGRLLFSATDASGHGQLFVSDGTAAGTVEVVPPAARSVGLSPSNLVAVDGTVYLQGVSVASVGAVWSTQGSVADTQLLFDASLLPTSFASVNGTIYFNGYVGGTLTVGIQRINPDGSRTELPLTGFTNPADLVGFGQYLLFRGTVGGVQSLLSYDTVGGTVTKLTTPDSHAPTGPANLTVYNGAVYFFASGGPSALPELWRTDGTVAGTSEIALPGVASTAALANTDVPIQVLSGKLLISATDTAHKTNPFVTDGTTATEITYATSGAGGLAPAYFAAADGTAVFTGVDTASHRDLFALDGATLTLTQINPAGAGNAFGILGFVPSFERAFSVACFRAGTRIETARGPVPVEALRPGDAVRGVDGSWRPVRWLGHRRIDCRRHPDPAAAWPIRVEAGAFGPHRPQRPLWLSPDHAVLLDGVLIPIRCLVNGATIARDPCAEVRYFHVELDRHAVILAEGLACESWLDTGNRADFDNAGPVVSLHPAFGYAEHPGACAPLATDGPGVAAARAGLAARASALGYRLTRAADIHVLAGRRLEGRMADGWLRFDLPLGVGRLRLRSRAVVPADRPDGAQDRRRLGVAVAALRCDGAELALDHPALGEGWHRPEGDWRWTDGDAALELSGAARLEVRIACGERYWVAEAAPAGRVAAAR